ncbi:xylulokinase [Desertibacillus haloalkaliphilus]|uniref:xylulokinase n=1 Tax=Desertibacillus haloalkaliphilus TaxID=1328930 RepID=UPI001C27BDB0|nr:FGGY family carbohydrate kinase [Desertibacillus haloalkaliphilus]MBU8906132.1 hypothetical protein [Desertibacillus haloalkaliphilus]
MSYIASFDIGTTSVKGILIKKDGSTTGKSSRDIETIHGPNGEIEQNPLDWWNGVVSIAQQWWNDDRISASDIAMITFSGQMQDVVPIDVNGEAKKAILYSDNRALDEADHLYKQFDDCRMVTGNHIDGASPFAKLLWLKKHRQDTFSNCFTFLFSSKDYVIYKLTDKISTDPTTGATTGIMNIKTRDWQKGWLTANHIPMDQLPPILAADEITGEVTDEAAQETGFEKGTAVLCGCGDAGATTMGAGAIREGEGYIYLGTTGWTAIPSNTVQQLEHGVFNLAHLPKDRYISIAPLSNIGNVHKWGVETLTKTSDEKSYTAFEELVASSPAGGNGLLFLPYIHGERFPVNDPNATGVYFGITASTTNEDMARSLIEGICYSLRQTFEVLIKEKSKTLTVLGGGTKSEAWCQTLANVLGSTISIPQNSEYIPAVGAAASAFIKLQWVDNYEAFADRILRSNTVKTYEPDRELEELYTKLYEKYLKLYPAVKDLM